MPMHIRHTHTNRQKHKHKHTHRDNHKHKPTLKLFSILLRDNVFPIYKILVASSGQVLGMHDHITSSEPCEIRCNAHNFCSAPCLQSGRRHFPRQLGLSVYRRDLQDVRILPFLVFLRAALGSTLTFGERRLLHIQSCLIILKHILKLYLFVHQGHRGRRIFTCSLYSPRILIRMKVSLARKVVGTMPRKSQSWNAGKSEWNSLSVSSLDADFL